MIRRPVRRAAALVAALVPIAVPAAGQTTAPDAAARAAYDSAYYAWEDGRYAASLERLDRLLAGPAAAVVLRDVALLTGELYATTELASDGRAVRWSPAGRLAAYESGVGADAMTHIVAIGADGVRPVASVRGGGLVFAADGSSFAWLTVPETPALRAARAEQERLAGARDFPAMREKAAEVVRLEQENTRVMVRAVWGGRERQLPTGELRARALVWPAGQDAPLVLAAPPGATNVGVHRAVGGRLVEVAAAEGPRSAPQLLGDGRVVFAAERGRFGVLDPATGVVTTHAGTQWSASADGSAIVFVAGAEGRTAVKLAGADGAERTVYESALPLANPAIAPDGSRIAFQMMPREDWELYVVPAAGGEPVRVTREIQHDLFPRFLSPTRLLAVKGEGRHRRSYVHDLARIDASGGAAEPLAAAAGPALPWQTRLFHNNTVRTVSPEYEWAVSPDGGMVLIVAERDGDTVSPERGVYVTDLSREVTAGDVRRRIAANLARERAIAAVAETAFGPIRADVAAVTGAVSVSRIYGYASDLYQFGSKYITQPGNAKAIDYLVAKLRSFGYEPELQWFEPRPGVRTANVIAKLPGTVDPELIYVVSSHFDSVERGPGADDDSSGSTALLEAARVLAGRPQARTLHFAFFTGEEAGLLGSREYVRRAQASGDRIVGALNNDMIGYANDQRLDNTIRYSNEGIRDIQHAAAQLFTALITYDAKYYKNTDAHAYYEAYGDIVGGIGSYPILANPHYHQTHDVLETINQQLVAEVSKATVATLMALAAAPSRVTGLETERAGERVDLRWIASPESDVVAYFVELGPPGAAPGAPVRVTEPRASLTGARAGDVVRVRAVNAQGLASWDRARAVVR